MARGAILVAARSERRDEGLGSHDIPTYPSSTDRLKRTTSLNKSLFFLFFCTHVCTMVYIYTEVYTRYILLYFTFYRFLSSPLSCSFFFFLILWKSVTGDGLLLVLLVLVVVLQHSELTD